jgi:acyl carrier protein
MAADIHPGLTETSRSKTRDIQIVSGLTRRFMPKCENSVGGVQFMSLRVKIFDEIRSLAAEQDVNLPPLSDDLRLLDSGLDSLCFAILVSRLEDMTGKDPFAASETFVYPQTIGELVNLYEVERV